MDDLTENPVDEKTGWQERVQPGSFNGVGQEFSAIELGTALAALGSASRKSGAEPAEHAVKAIRSQFLQNLGEELRKGGEAAEVIEAMKESGFDLGEIVRSALKDTGADTHLLSFSDREMLNAVSGARKNAVAL